MCELDGPMPVLKISKMLSIVFAGSIKRFQENGDIMSVFQPIAWLLLMAVQTFLPEKCLSYCAVIDSGLK
ncbi:hypothetical protein [Endozoicomonas sp. SCSIO W0465]|uniref:hypothetical protein n=1 Tax=Endozoicomonas sp. SCSIO W0465 TaxID=2918516 RepID=UPI0020758214|nr:hypothetical protein [Endozoicomonas sp. SCSIO W0465]USE39891.1 hypothetical protein MJO57_14625 [Endozoicomonas sp. SCSIO W0465]